MMPFDAKTYQNLMDASKTATDKAVKETLQIALDRETLALALDWLLTNGVCVVETGGIYPRPNKSIAVVGVCQDREDAIGHLALACGDMRQKLFSALERGLPERNAGADPETAA